MLSINLLLLVLTINLCKHFRFWYDLGMDGKIPNFQLEELAEIRKVTMARIICDNTKDLNEMQPSAFEMSNSYNQAVPCQDLPNLDITKFQGLT